MKKTNTYRLVVFAPKNVSDLIRRTALAHGAEVTGTFRYHSFSVKGVGSFLSTDGAHPITGLVGADSVSDENRLEFSVSSRKLTAVTDAIRDVHPDEDPAIDAYPIGFM